MVKLPHDNRRKPNVRLLQLVVVVRDEPSSTHVVPGFMLSPALAGLVIGPYENLN